MSSENETATPHTVHHYRARTSERLAVAELPTLTERIDAMGLTQEYAAFRDRFLGWRRGAAHGARGELNTTDLVERPNVYGFGFWYPNKEVWNFRRTLSYWIAVTFFEGSIFFTISSFCFCYKEALGDYGEAMTTYGYIAGKVNFLICTYFMCLETINLTTHERSHCESPSASNAEHGLPAGTGEGHAHKADESDTFRYWPFCFNTALANLDRLGAGPWPYFASLIYFIGVNTYLVGLVAEFLPIPHPVAKWTALISFLLGSILFVLGGLAECIENEVFTSLKCNLGWWGALLNEIGGLLFLLGSILDFFDGMGYWGSFSFGVGSIVFALGSSAMLIMWKDEQFGLTFFAALNNLGGPNGRPLVVQGGVGEVKEEATFSWRGSIFIFVYILAASVSVYNFLTSMTDIHKSGYSSTYVMERSFNALLPCIFAHALLGLNSAVVKMPKGKPFRQLYIGCRFLALFMVASGVAQLVQTLRGDARPCDNPVSGGAAQLMQTLMEAA